MHFGKMTFSPDKGFYNFVLFPVLIIILNFQLFVIFFCLLNKSVFNLKLMNIKQIKVNAVLIFVWVVQPVFLCILFIYLIYFVI